MEKILRSGAKAAFRNSQIPARLSVVSTIKTEESMNDHIDSLCKQKSYREAMEAFDFAQKNSSFKIRLKTYGSLICACSSSRSLAQGRKIHDQISKSDCKHDTVLNNHILSMYGKCGSLREAREVFDFMPQRNLVSYTSVITGYSQNGQEREAIKLYMEMLRAGLVPDQYSFGSIIKACASAGDAVLGKQLHTQVIKLEPSSSLFAQNALIAMYVSFGRITDARKVFCGIPVKDVISWGSIIAGYSQLGYEFEALGHLKDMLSYGVFQPNEYIFGSSLKACSSLLRADYGSQIHGLCIKSGFSEDAFAGCSLCDMYARCGFLSSARRVFYLIERPDTASWNVIIAGLANNGYADEAVSFFSQMRSSGYAPDATSLRSLLCGQTNEMGLRQGRQIHSFIVKYGLVTDLSVCNSLLTMYSCCSDLYCCFKMFEDLRNEADSVSWNAILTACLRHEQPAEVLRLFKMMLVSECVTDHITMGNLLRACVEISSLKLGSQVHCYNFKTGLVLEQFIINGLIDMYAKCGSLEQARRVFDSMDDNKDVVSWSTLIVGYAQSGFGEEALTLFKAMKSSGIEPNHVTFVGVLTACSHVGLVEEGLKLYAIMQSEHRIAPTKEHCSCVVDLLARAGHLDEAEKFIDEMKLEPDVVVWKTLLSACKTQGNVDLARKAAENILNIDPFNSTAHVLLCGIHASSGNWEDAALMRSSMKRHDVKKVPGQSWIEVKDERHVFFAEDVLHPKRDDIYTVLQNIFVEMLDESRPQHKRRL
ncbi:Pentatricopeptide repeat-containing protein [Raphanus sativus]|uniref:Pentatricopeptide repeat-containing protein At3g53360, mitochondrial n=1 Tax=Raphanus sativus TaxID=3726 RepID=A0A6J0NTF6_RAPSA|nr:pentatricopeptide repeat-containing protein At3g53360, mitochondrial [Raphanus sativus]XP_056866719.1 pentatricopeptide repeat-containing protein At3g53360, mitochondrial [Raphanus sativus]KAJ4895737.1 Pentatricopeptide repeat-containing protein [Raphanus sativus]